MEDTQINAFGVCVLAAWLPLIMLMFATMSARRAVITAFVVGYLFLPEAAYHLHTLPDITKSSLTAVGVVLASLIFDSSRLFSIRWRMIDLVWVVLWVSPFVTSLSNGLGLMDGLSSSMNLLFRWGLAYWIGRAYFTDWEGLRELAVGIILGGMAYVPLCWWEIRMSPQLHGILYGQVFNSFRTDSYLFGVRMFGFRPNVFVMNGLTVTMYMTMSAVLAFWMWMSGAPKKLMGIKMGWIAFALVVTAIFCKAMGAMFLMVCAIGLLSLTRWPKTRLPILLLLLAPPLYIGFRAAGDWSGDFLLEAANAMSPTRADSLEFRMKNENVLAAKAMQQPLLGWGGWKRSHVLDQNMVDTTIPDGLWIILLGENGLVGIGAFVLLALGSAFLVWYRIPTRFWRDPACAAAVALAVVVMLYMIDSLFNATFNSVTALVIGAVASISGIAKRTFGSARPAQVPMAQQAYARFPAVVSSVKDIPYVYSPIRS
jgi:hypothetical protein